MEGPGWCETEGIVCVMADCKSGKVIIFVIVADDESSEDGGFISTKTTVEEFMLLTGRGLHLVKVKVITEIRERVCGCLRALADER